MQLHNEPDDGVLSDLKQIQPKKACSSFQWDEAPQPGSLHCCTSFQACRNEMAKKGRTASFEINANLK